MFFLDSTYVDRKKKREQVVRQHVAQWVKDNVPGAAYVEERLRVAHKDMHDAILLLLTYNAKIL